MALYPSNDSEIVEKLGKLLNTDLDQVISLKNTDEDSSKKHPFPCPTSYRTALTSYVDVCTPPRTHVLKELSEHCSDERDKARLKVGFLTTSFPTFYSNTLISGPSSVVGARIFRSFEAFP